MLSDRFRARSPWRAVLPTLIAALAAPAAVARAQSPVTAQRHAVDFASTDAAPSATTQDVVVTNGGATSLANSAVAFGVPQYPVGAPTGWLVATRTQTGAFAAGATLKLGTLGIKAGQLPRGTYRASVAVNATVSGTTTADSIVVMLDVAGPTIALSTTAVTITPTTAAPQPTVPVVVSNTGSTQLAGIARGTVEYLTGPVAGWLNANAAFFGGTLDAGQSGTMNLSLSRTDLPRGTYTARFPISSTNATNGPLWVTVTLEQAGPVLAAEGAAGIALATVPGSSAVLRATFGVRNVGTSNASGVRPGTITYEPGATGWLQASAGTSADLGPNGTRFMDLAVGGGYNLAPGTYRAHVPVTTTNGDDAAPPTATVTLTVGTPAMSVSPSTLVATADATTPTPATRTLSIANGGTSTLRNVKRTIGYAAGEPTGWMSIGNAEATQVIPGSPSSFTVSFHPSALPAGTYHGTVTVTADLVEPQVVNVTITRGGAQIAVATSVGITPPSGGGTGRRDVPVTNGGAGTLSGLSTGTVTYAAGQPTGWITSAVMQSATAPTNLQILTNSIGLAAGTYTATVPVLAPGASNSPQHVVVTYTVSPAAVFFGGAGAPGPKATLGGADPAPSSITVTNSGGAVLTGLAASVAYTSGAATGWLDATLDGSAAPATMTLQPHTGTLAPGVYVARVTVTGADATPLSINVNFTVLDAPTIGFQLSGSNSTAPTTAATVTQGGAAPAPVVFSVRNLAGGTLDDLAVSSVTHAAGEPTGWLAGVLAGTVAPANLTLTANPTGLAPGTYTGKVWVSSPAAGNGPQAITYTLTVKPAPVVALSRTSIATTIMAGSTPGNESISITSGTGSAMSGIAVAAPSYGAGEPTGWLSASAPAGSITAGGSTTTALSFATAALAPGVYHASVAVSAADAIGGPRTIAVTLTVTRRPAIVLSASALALDALVGGATTAPATVEVTNGGDDALHGLELGAVAYGAGASGWLDARLSGTTAPATVTLRATPTGLAAGTYTAVVPVVSTSAATSNSPRTITVAFTIGEPPARIAFARPSALLSIQVNALVARSGTVAVTNGGGGGTLAGLALAPIAFDGARTGWMTASLSGTTAPATLTLRTQTRGVPAGYYTATLSLAAAGAPTAALPVAIEVIDLKAAEGALVDPTKLPDAERARLDALGNHDGTYNLGDYVALRARLGLN